METTKAGFQKKYYISGFQKHQAKRVCEYFFGDYFVSIKLNEKDTRFDIKLKKTLLIGGKDMKIQDYLNIDDFKSFWGPQWRLVFEVDELI